MRKILLTISMFILVQAIAQPNKSSVDATYNASISNPDGTFSHVIDLHNNTGQTISVVLECDGFESTYVLGVDDVSGTVEFNLGSNQAKRVKVIPSNGPPITLIIKDIIVR